MTRRFPIYAMAAGTVFFWGASFPLTKVALEWLGPVSLAFLRWAIAAAILAAWLAVQNKRTSDRKSEGKLALLGRLTRQDGWPLSWVALTGVTLFYILENVALQYTTATNAGVLSNLVSIFIVLLSVVWLRERLTIRGWLAVGVAFVGAALLSQGAGNLTLSKSGLRGDLLMVLAAFFAAIYSVGGKRLVAAYPADVVTTGVAMLGALFLLPLALIEGLSLALPAIAWGALVLLGAGAGALANLWWLHILAHTTASRAGVALFAIPITSTILAVVALHEPLSLVMVLGAGLVLAGVAVMQREA